jgi:hypothetical protein
MREKLLRRIEAYQAQRQLHDADSPIGALIDDGLHRTRLALEKHDRELAEVKRMTQIAHPESD